MTEPHSLPVEAARKQFADLLNGSQFRGEHTEITRHGKAAGYLVPPDWYERALQALTRPSTTPTHHERPSPVAAMNQPDLVAKLTDSQAGELAGRAFVNANPSQYKALEAAASNGNHGVVYAAVDLGLLDNTDLLTAS